MSQREIPGLVPRLKPLGTTVFAHYSAIATETGAINLGQGFPDVDGPSWIADAVTRAIAEGRGNQYPAGVGVLELRKAVVGHQKRWYGIDNDFAIIFFATWEFNWSHKMLHVLFYYLHSI